MSTLTDLPGDYLFFIACYLSIHTMKLPTFIVSNRKKKEQRANGAIHTHTRTHERARMHARMHVRTHTRTYEYIQ